MYYLSTDYISYFFPGMYKLKKKKTANKISKKKWVSHLKVQLSWWKMALLPTELSWDHHVSCPKIYYSLSNKPSFSLSQANHARSVSCISTTLTALRHVHGPALRVIYLLPEASPLFFSWWAATFTTRHHFPFRDNKEITLCFWLLLFCFAFSCREQLTDILQFRNGVNWGHPSEIFPCIS